MLPILLLDWCAPCHTKGHLEERPYRRKTALVSEFCKVPFNFVGARFQKFLQVVMLGLGANEKKRPNKQRNEHCSLQQTYPAGSPEERLSAV